MVFVIITFYEILICILSLFFITKNARDRILRTKKFFLSYSDTAGKERKRYFLKCCSVVFLQYAFLNKSEVKIFFAPLYTDNAFKRLADWIIFYFNNLKYSLSKKEDKIKPAEPIHFQTFFSVNEPTLEDILKKGGFKIIDEKITSTTSTYIIGPE